MLVDEFRQKIKVGQKIVTVRVQVPYDGGGVTDITAYDEEGKELEQVGELE